ncbi:MULTISPECIES: hypothetical protein [unclassified Mesorhizobium]|uniref:hypothetical protein n=1 Tax=unclassified Mesorhizobium TaxID=325217 RepID=UPI00112DC7B4|nr:MULTISPECIES: hypothetical protein [unclassified Mesorhizobium]TPM06762.1 hypothetical protein FJ939_11905 [Mesorhizobium sp. B2-3-8]TPM15357.1 hypothetical protein FJ940_14205 [Mesorhizobium sp. B2-3-7]
MVARPGRMQSATTAGELDPSLHDRWELKYFGTGSRRMENVQIIPQGGFKVRDGLRDVGAVDAAAARLFAFDASDGSSYDLVFKPLGCAMWGETAQLDTVVTGLTAGMLSTFTVAQQLDTMLLFHVDLKPQRIKILAPNNWAIDDVPFVGIPTYDYGGVYTNGVAAEWEIEFAGLSGTTSFFILTVSNQDTLSIDYTDDMLVMATAVQDAVLDLPNVAPGVTVVSSSGDATGKKVRITFSGAGNEGDGWAVSGRVINKADAAVLSFKVTPGVDPGEDLISATKGWPHCGAFYSQRLLIGGFKSLPNAWMFSKTGDYFNYDKRFSEANGPALIPMDVAGGERIERIVPNRNLLIFTTQAEYWLAERALSKTTAPNHVQSSRHGARRGVPIAENEGAALFLHSDGDVLGENRYTDVEGNFVATDISLLAPHLVNHVKDQAVRRATNSTSGNLQAMIQDDGAARLVTILREQEVTAFTRMTTAGTPIAVSVNGRNEMSWLIDRPDARRLERFENGLLLDAAISFTYGVPTTVIAGLARFNGRDVWAIGDDDVFGPFHVGGGSITLPAGVMAVTVGTWSPPVVQTLPLPRTVGPNIVLKRRARIHSVILSVLDTTSIAIGVNGKAPVDVDLLRYGAVADLPELQAPFTGDLKLRGLTGYQDDPYVTITQNRPGRMTVRSITIEAAL